MYPLIISLLLVFGVWGFERYYLRGKPVETYPTPSDPDAIRTFSSPDGPGPEHESVVHSVRKLTSSISPSLNRKNIKSAREVINSFTDGRHYSSQFHPTYAGSVAAEWVLAPGASSARRFLYIHGGGFIIGSPKSHRTITNRFSEITGCAVLAIDYRLLPENKHMDSVEDCRSSYRWILDNGPDGPEPVQQLYIGGDSAGGNLVLSLTAWVRDNRLRAPEAVVAFSPLTDSTFSGASIRGNEATDIMLAPALKALRTLPRFFRSWWVLFAHRMRPSNPVISPLLGDLSNLPPILIQASEAEMLLDDARRYANKACASGSPVKLQIWAEMLHVWQIFYPELPQAEEAWRQVDKFLKTNSSS